MKSMNVAFQYFRGKRNIFRSLNESTRAISMMCVRITIEPRSKPRLLSLSAENDFEPDSIEMPYSS